MVQNIAETHGTCPKCGSNDAVTWFDDGRGHCHGGCGGATVYKEGYVPIHKREIKGVSYKGIRNIDEDVCKMFGIQLQLDENNKPVRYAFKYEDNTKYRAYDFKKFWFKEAGLGNDSLFGPEFNAGSSKRLYLTEGEFDAASLFQALGKSFPVKSIPSAGIGDKFLKKNYEYLNSFENIVWAGDNDEAGKQACEKLYSVFPDKFYYVPITKYKDANEFLQNGAEEELKWAGLKPQRYTPDNFYINTTDFDKILDEENPYEYVPTPVTALNDCIRGLVKGGMTLFKAPPGTGKTDVFRFFQYHLLKNTNQKIAVLHMEEMKSTTLRGVATYELGNNVRTKEDAEKNGIPEQEVREAIYRVVGDENLILFEIVPTDGVDIMDAIVNYIRLAITVYGADFIFLDHIQRLAYMAGVDNATSKLTELSVKIEDLCKRYNVGFIAISHVNNEGAAKYAKALEEGAIIMLEIERDKEAEDEEERNTTYIKCTKNRPFSKLGNAGLLSYCPATTLIEEKVL